MRLQMAEIWDERGCVRVLLPVLGAVMLFGLAAPGWGQAEQYSHTAEDPAPPYWFRNVEGVGRQAGAMDPRLKVVSEAFGRGEFEVSRQLAEALVQGANDDDLRSEAAALVVESHLSVGSFAAAREAAEDLRSVSPDVCQDLLAHVNREEHHYQDEVNRLQRVVATTEDLGAAARAQLRIARVHHMFGRLEQAGQSCQEVIMRNPSRPEAVCAVSQLALMAMERGEYAKGLSQMEEVVRHHPNTPAGLRARMAIPRIYLAQGKSERALEVYSAIIRGHPRTGAAAEAQFAIGEICQQQGKDEEAEAAYLAAARNYRGTAGSRQARDALAKMYYSRGEAAMAAGWNPAAGTASLEAYRKGVHVDPDTERKSKYTLHVAELYGGLQRWQEARAAARQVLKLDPPTQEFYLRRKFARTFMAYAYHQEGLLLEALARYKELLADYPDLKQGEKDTFAIAIADIESQLNPNPLYVDAPSEHDEGAQEEVR